MSAKRGLPTTKWRWSPENRDLQQLLARELGIHPIVSQILASRDITGPDEAHRYLFPSLNDLHNPLLMKDMHRGVERVVKAIYGDERLVVYGDYDVDGITSVVCLLKFLRELGMRADYYIPDRLEEGYSLNRDAITKMKAEGVQLIVTVDCGISAHEEVAYAKSLDIDSVCLLYTSPSPRDRG